MTEPPTILSDVFAAIGSRTALIVTIAFLAWIATQLVPRIRSIHWGKFSVHFGPRK